MKIQTDDKNYMRDMDSTALIASNKVAREQRNHDRQKAREYALLKREHDQLKKDMIVIKKHLNIECLNN